MFYQNSLGTLQLETYPKHGFASILTIWFKIRAPVAGASNLCNLNYYCSLNGKFRSIFQLPSVKSQQYQTILRSSLRSSKVDAIKNFWKVTNCGNNIQYDTYQNTKQVLKSIRDNYTERLKSKLPSQGFIITFLLDRSLRISTHYGQKHKANCLLTFSILL